MIHQSDPPVLLHDVFDDVGQVVALLERNAPYTPLGGWYRPGLDPDVATNPMWFQNDWVHAGMAVEGSELFTGHERVLEAARRFYDAEVAIPHTLYVNLMASVAECGPAHTDNPKFRGRDRSNTPMWLLRSMLWSGLFERWAVSQATSIWWLNDVEGGGLRYWPDGPDKPPQRHCGAMANTALVGDNHGMFHQVEEVGPFDAGTRLVTARAELGPAADGSGDWVVTDRGQECYRAPLDTLRVSVLMKADVYPSEEERQRLAGDLLSLEEVARIFDDDLVSRGAGLRFDLERIEDLGFAFQVAEIYPEAVPVGAGRSVFEALAS